ncbi:hypothetical protein MKX42_29555 [Paenibacillus sp. FSL R7-0204]|uniref:hypothetical protein n=1 Tax=Paenibacillus sp. FSL R7-0204 TaxID=2921675 RepID=UPI0030F99ABF
MGNKQWNFKIPGSTEDTALTIDTKHITTVYDLLDRLRQAQSQTPQVTPFHSSAIRKRRYPSA